MDAETFRARALVAIEVIQRDRIHDKDIAEKIELFDNEASVACENGQISFTMQLDADVRDYVIAHAFRLRYRIDIGGFTGPWVYNVRFS